MGLLDFMGLFQDEDDVPPDAREAERYQAACGQVSWAEAKEWAEFVDRLEATASKPFVISDHPSMIASAARTNTLREVAELMRQDAAKAKSFVERYRKEKYG